MALLKIDLSGIHFDFSGLFDAIKRLLGPFGVLLDKIKQAWDKGTNVVNAATKLKDSVVAEITGWKNFKQDIRFSQRVIQIESAISKTRDLIEGLPAAWQSILDIVKQVKAQIGGVDNPVSDAEEAVEGVESGGIKNLLERFPKLAKGLEKVLGFLSILVTALESIVNVIDDLQSIVDELRRLRLEIEKLDTIFLSQSNKRKVLHLDNGKRIKIRLGKLHPSV